MKVRIFTMLAAIAVSTMISGCGDTVTAYFAPPPSLATVMPQGRQKDSGDALVAKADNAQEEAPVPCALILEECFN